MKDNSSLTDRQTKYLIQLMRGRNSPALLVGLVITEFVLVWLHRFIYETYGDLSFFPMLLDTLMVSAGGFAGMYAFTVISFRLNEKRHAFFGLIELALVVATCIYSMRFLIGAGIDPQDGPPIFGSILMSALGGWVFGFLLAGIKRNTPEDHQ